MVVGDTIVSPYMHEVTQGDARLHGACESDKNGLRHVEGHDSSGRCEGHQAEQNEIF